MPAPPQIISQVVEAMNPLWNSNAIVHTDLIAFEEAFAEFSCLLVRFPVRLLLCVIINNPEMHSSSRLHCFTCTSNS